MNSTQPAGRSPEGNVMRVRILIAFACATLIAGSFRHVDAPAADEPPAAQPEPAAKFRAAAPSRGLPLDWKKDLDVPEARNDAGQIRLRATKLKLWVEQGWLIACHESDRGLEWQIVLAQATDPNPPQARLDRLTGFEVKYGPYFIREHFGHLRVFRERKTKDSPVWPQIRVDQGAKLLHDDLRGDDRSAFTSLTVWEIGSWHWLGAGIADTSRGEPKPADCRFDIWMRVQHNLVKPIPQPSDPTMNIRAASSAVPEIILALRDRDCFVYDE